MHAAAEYGSCHGAADYGSGDIVKKARKYKHQHQQHRWAAPVIGQDRRQQAGYMAFLKLIRQQGETNQQAKQVAQHHPLVREVEAQTGQARYAVKCREHQLVQGDR